MEDEWRLQDRHNNRSLEQQIIKVLTNRDIHMLENVGES